MSNYIFNKSIKLAENAMLKARPELFDEWDFEKNDELGLDIYQVTKGSNKKVWWIGQCGHEWKAIVYSRIRGSNCPYCSNNRLLVGFNDMWTTNPYLAKQLLNPEDGYRHMQGSSRKVDWKCPCCDFIINNKSIRNIYRQGLYCSNCSDNSSYPEKVVANVLHQLKINTEKEKIFIWSKNKRYDFYISSLNLIIEVHGKQHYEEGGFKNWRGLKEEQENDRIKEQLAKDNGIRYYIVIDARHSDIDWIKNSLLNSKLNHLVALNKISWSLVERYALHTLVKDICDMWNNNLQNVSAISQQTRLSKGTIRRYLKRGQRLGWCNYNVIEVMNDTRKNGNKNTINIVQLDINGAYLQCWNSIAEARRNTRANNIMACLKGRRKKSGGYRWMYKEDYESMIKENNI